MTIRLEPLTQSGMAWAKEMIERGHYLHKMPHPFTRPFGYAIQVMGARAGLLLFGRPQATRQLGWFGNLEDVATGLAPVTNWQVLNLSRVWIDPDYQTGGKWCIPNLSGRHFLPGFTDRKGVYRSYLASTAIKMAMERIGLDYLLHAPPVFLDQPYEIVWLLSYCNTALHRGVIYQKADFEDFGTNEDGIQTWRIPLAGLNEDGHMAVREASLRDKRAIRMRAKQAQPALF